MPGLQPGTVLFTWDVPNGEYYSGYALSAQLNWTYADEIVDRVVPYEFILLSSGQNKEIKSLTPNTVIQSDFRTYSFIGNTSDSVYVAYDGEGCLRVLDAQLTPPLGVLADYSKEVLDAASLSNLSLITTEGSNPNHPPLEVLGAEPSHNWCYYFEKAELARQFKQYDQTIALLNEAQAKGFKPLELSEWYPFIDAYLHIGNLDEAQRISQVVLAEDNKIFETGVCHIWAGFSEEITGSASQKDINSIMQSLGCQ